MANSRDHDHSDCIDQALAHAEGVCADGGGRLTALRRAVLCFVWRGHEAVKAYEILAHLSDGTRSAKPPTVYRTLRFLLERGLVHRLESLNAFVGCPAPADPHEGQFLICGPCGLVREIRAPRVSGAVARKAREAGFQVERTMIEVLGICGACRKAGAAP